MSLEEYTADILRVPMLTCDEEIILGNQVQKMISILKKNNIEESITKKNFHNLTASLLLEERKAVSRGLKARNRIISANMRLVLAVANKIKTSQVHLTIQDMVQEGAIGLARAAEKFEPGRGYKFSTYAYWWIRQGIMRASEYQERAIRVPANVQKLSKEVKYARLKLLAKFSKEPTIEEIAIELNETVEKVSKAIEAGQPITSLDLDAAASAGARNTTSSTTLIELIPAALNEDTEKEEDRSWKLNLLLSVISALTKDEEEFIKQRYGIGCEQLSIRQIAKRDGVSELSIKHKHQMLINKIRYATAIMQSHDAQEFTS